MLPRTRLLISSSTYTLLQRQADSHEKEGMKKYPQTAQL